eukprot:COSAG06_NODE_23497_length_689_cov_11.755932_1_plen_95_part_10
MANLGEVNGRQALYQKNSSADVNPAPKSCDETRAREVIFEGRRAGGILVRTKYGCIYVKCSGQDDKRRSVPHSEAHDATAAARYPMLNVRTGTFM